MRAITWAGVLGAWWVAAGGWAAEVLPVGSAPPALASSHFPDRMHAFVWRNWPVVEVERMAKVLGTTPENVTAVARSMGLPPQGKIDPAWRTRGYITVLRRNWHLLPYDQMLVLLDRSAEDLAYCLREDDFLFVKLGNLKPSCPPLRYQPPDDKARAKAAWVRQVVEESFGAEWGQPEEPRFAFVEKLGRALPAPAGRPARKENDAPRFIYSYFALFGDPLANPELDPYPDGLLGRLAAEGVNGVWLHTVLRTLAPSRDFPEFGAGHEARLEALARLVQRAKRYGIDVYLYVNEPRAMPPAFFEKPGRDGLRGVREGDHWTMCTSAPAVRRWLTESLAFVFAKVPDLGGAFTITASENLTNCASHGHKEGCPRCQGRTTAEILAEVNAAVEEGVHRGNPRAQVIVWDWGWPDDQAAGVISRLPKSVWLQSVSEWSLPIRRGGVATEVGEYSLSAVGPGPRALRHWELARQAGLRTSAKVQVNVTWELAAVPYLPVLDLVAEHAARLGKAGVQGRQLSWSLGGYPSPNLRVVRLLGEEPGATAEAVLDRVAREQYGPGAAAARRGWSQLSRAMTEYPYHGQVVYQAPQQMGPANLLYLEKTGYRATMVGLPYDDLDGWRGPYPAEVFAGQFEKLARGWEEGVRELRAAADQAPAAMRAACQDEVRFAAAAGLHFASVADQARFVLARDALGTAMTPREVAAQTRALQEVARAELTRAVALARLAREDSRLGYEASNHYFYLPIDLAEKVLNCRQVLDDLER